MAAQAERWVAEMEERGVEARVTTYTAVVDACAKSAYLTRATSPYRGLSRTYMSHIRMLFIGVWELSDVIFGAF